MAANQNPFEAVEVAGGDDSIDRWERCWQEGRIPWDLGQTTPLITDLVQASKLPEGKVLVPGCGSGYDVVAMATPNRKEATPSIK
ncbi:hypothetical protein HPP92_011581 [Vanilla planifolia]|uniref:Uncharacterized protein n=1 Tax=Vanilla planifolia TaxID=51239 RepID=A0A835R6B6_VANPL|nr:hypothetical protein HPP92_011581 [Vanilla planifolia]